MSTDELRLGRLQLRIMQVLWASSEPLGVTEVRNGLAGESLAYTTVATMLRKMEQRGLMRHREEGRRFVYWPVVSSDEVTRSAAEQYVDQLFQGNLSAAVSHLLETRDVDRGELAELERLIQARRKHRG